MPWYRADTHTGEIDDRELEANNGLAVDRIDQLCTSSRCLYRGQDTESVRPPYPHVEIL